MAKIGDPRELFLHKLGAAYTMEQTVEEMLEKNAEEAQDPEVSQKFSHHLDETHRQVTNIERAFEALGQDPKGQACPAIDGLKKEGEQSVKQVEEVLVDHVLVGGATEVEHHEIAVYNGLITKAEALGEEDVVALLRENLEQEEHTLKEVEQKAQQLARQVRARAR
jgi:ferritin-like metal-binding protein YciE